MLTLDHNVLRSTIRRGQFLDVLTFFNNRLLDRAGAVRSPVLVQFGEFDPLYPGPVEAPNEKTFFPSSPRVQVTIIPKNGHSLNNHKTAQESWVVVDRFLKSLH